MSARKVPSAKEQPIAPPPREARFGRGRSFYYSVLLHATLIAVVVIGIDWKSSTVITPAAAPNVMQATAVDASKVAEEVRKLKSAEQQKLAAEQKRQEDAEKRVQEEERKLAQIKEAQEAARRAKEQENRALEAEKQRLETEKEQAAVARQKAEAAKKKAEAEKKKAEAEAQRAAEKRQQEEAAAKAKAAEEAKKKKAAEEKKRAEEEAKKQAEEKKRQQAAEAEAALKEALAAEEAALQASQDATELQRYMARIQAAISGGFVYPPGLPPGLKCTLFVRVIPGGEVVEARVVQSSGNAVFDRQAETAVRKASPLPVPEEPRLMQQMREFNFVFEPES